jgi:hypothetical protein
MTKKPSYAELQAQVKRLTEDSLKDVDTIGACRRDIGLQLTEIDRLQGEVAWLKSRWPVLDKAVISVTSTGNEPVEPISTTDTESSGSVFAWVFGIVLAAILLGLAAWQAYTYYAPKVLPKQTAVVTEPSIQVGPLVNSGTTAPLSVVQGVAFDGINLLITANADNCWIQASTDAVTGLVTLGKGEGTMLSAKDSITIRDGCPGKIVFMRDGVVVHPTPEPGHKKDVEVVKFERNTK